MSQRDPLHRQSEPVCMHWHIERNGTAFRPASEARCVECGATFREIFEAPHEAWVPLSIRRSRIATWLWRRSSRQSYERARFLARWLP